MRARVEARLHAHRAQNRGRIRAGGALPVRSRDVDRGRARLRIPEPAQDFLHAIEPEGHVEFAQRIKPGAGLGVGHRSRRRILQIRSRVTIVGAPFHRRKRTVAERPKTVPKEAVYDESWRRWYLGNRAEYAK